MVKPRILILGKLPPPLMGPSLATEIILKSELNEPFDLHHFDTRINTSVAQMGRYSWSKLGIIRKKYRHFKRVLKKVKPDLVLIPIGQTSAGFFKDVPFIRMAAQSGAKVIIQLRGSAWLTWYRGLDAFRQKTVRNQIQKTDAVIVLGNNLRFIFEDFYPKDRIFVVPNGADYSFPERVNTGLTLTYLANYLPGKGILEVLKALKILSENQHLPAFEFHAYGSWDAPNYRSQCELLAQAMPHVHLNTSVSGVDKWQALADSDIFVFAPRSPEGHPWCIVEALAAGLPIVATNRGAICQSVVDGENGFLLKNPEPEILAQKLEMLLKDEQLRNQMGKASRKKYLTENTAAMMVDRLKTVFDTVLNLE